MSETSMNNNTRNNSSDEIDLVDLIRVYIRKWLFLGCISLGVAVIVFLFVKVFLNNGNKTWTVEFEFIYPGYASGMYPDGTTFRYQDIISDDILKNALASDTKFNQYSSSDILKHNIISVSELKKKKKIDGNEVEEVVPGRYFFTVIANYFESVDDAESLLSAILQSASSKVLSSADSVYYQVYLDSYETADTFQSKLNYLNLQKIYITSKYEEWIEEYGEQFTVNGMALSRHLQNASQAFTDKEYSSLSYELQKRQYVYNKAADEELICRLQIEILNDEFEDNTKKIQGLTEALENLRKTQSSASTEIGGTQSNETYYYEQIAKLTERQVDIERNIKDIETQISNMSMVAETAEYSKKLDTVRDNLLKQTQVLENTIAPAVYKDKTIAALELGGFTTSGVKSAPLFALVAFVVMYLMVGFIIFILGEDTTKENKKKIKTA